MRLFSLIILGVVLFAGAVFAMTNPLPGATARETVGERKTFSLLANQAGLDTGAQDAMLVWHELGDGPPVVMLASAGREASDFNELAQAIVDAGYKAVLVQPPGIDGAAASREAPDLFDLARDLEPIIRAQGEPVVMLGHAFGNRVARATATAYPTYVRGTVLVASGGARPVPEKANAALFDCFNPVMTAARRAQSVRYAFFAGDNEIPAYWMRGWHGDTARLQGAATRNTDAARWIAGGDGPILVIAGLQDRIAPPEDTIDLLEADYPDRVTPVRIDGAGHALLPEKPDEIAGAVIGFLEGLDRP